MKDNFENFTKRSTLSVEEASEFKQILKQDKLKKEQGLSKLSTILHCEEIKENITRNRMQLLETLKFSENEIDLYKSVYNVNNDVRLKKAQVYSILKIIDYKFVAEEKIGMLDAIDGKFLFILGLLSLKNINELSKENVLAKILYFLRDYAYYAYNTVYNDINSFHLDDVNEQISSLGSILSISSKEAVIHYTADTLHFDCVFDKSKQHEKFSYYISDNDAKTINFKHVYDFYFNNQCKDKFQSETAKKTKDIINEKFEKSKQMVLRAKSKSEEKELVAHYNNVVNSKLKNLRARNDKIV